MRAASRSLGPHGGWVVQVYKCGTSALCVLALWGAVSLSYARADEGQSLEPVSAETSDPYVRPWSEGVSELRKAEAQRLLEEGNAHFLRSDHRAALASYQEALKSWDHPAIRFNVARSLIQLDRAVEAYENLEHALRYGPSALEDHVYVEAQGYMRLLRSQIGELDVRCDQAGAQVSIDGRSVLACPGALRVRLLPGKHLVVGSQAGFLTLTNSVLVLPAATQIVDVKLVSIRDATQTVRRWSVWKPWTVAAAGGATIAVAGLLRWQAKQHYAEYSADVARLCAESSCAPDELPASTRKLNQRAEREDRSAIAVGVVGVSVTVLGLTLALLNQPRAVLTQRDPWVVTPVVTPHSVSGSVGGRF